VASKFAQDATAATQEYLKDYDRGETLLLAVLTPPAAVGVLFKQEGELMKMRKNVNHTDTTLFVGELEKLKKVAAASRVPWHSALLGGDGSHAQRGYPDSVQR
jgi:hypothetical protein